MNDDSVRTLRVFFALCLFAAACRSATSGLSDEPASGANPGLVLMDQLDGPSMKPTMKTDTLQARNIVLVDENGKGRLVLSGGESRFGPLIVVGDEDDGLGITLGYFRTGLDQKGPRAAVIHAESGDFGNLTLSVEPKGAHLYMGADQTDQFEITCDKDGLVVLLEPDDAQHVVSTKTGSVEAVSKDARGVRLTLDHGRIIVHDLDGHELGALPDPAPGAPTAPH
jgi:hypothetical protein